MHRLHLSAKRLLLNRSYSIPFTGLAELPLHAILHRYLLEEEAAQKNIINKFTRHFSVSAEDRIHETSLMNLQEGRLMIDVYGDVSLSQCMHTAISEERKCKREGLEHGALELSGGATISNSVLHVDDCAHTDVDDSVSACVLVSQKGYEKKKGKSCNEGISELVVAEAGTISHIDNEKKKQFDNITSELAETNCSLKQKGGNKHFDGSASELAIFNGSLKQKGGNKHSDGSASELAMKQKGGNKLFDASTELAVFNSCKASCKDINKEKHFDSSMEEHASETVQTMKFPSRGKQGHIINDSTSEFFTCDIKNMLQNHAGELMKKERLKLSVDNIETGLQREDIGMLMVKDASEVCVSDAKTSKNAEERTCSDLCGFLKGVGASEKPESFTTEQGLVSRPCETVYCAVQKKINKNKKKKNKKRKKKKKKASQFGPEDLEQLSLSPHPFHFAAAGQALCNETTKIHGENFKDDHTCLPNYSLIQLKFISPVTCQKSPGYADSIDSVSRDALELRESVDAIFADRRQVNQGITNGFAEENQNCENSSKSKLEQGQKLGEASKHMQSVKQSNVGEGEVFKNQRWEVSQDAEHMTGKIWGLCEKGPSRLQEDAHRPFLTEKEQAHLNDLSHNEVIDKGSFSPTHLVGKWRSAHSTMKPHMNEASGYFLGNRGKTIAYKQIKDGTSLDPSSKFWERVRTIAPVETIECGLERAKWDLAGVRKVHYPLRNYRELYIILDLNGVLIKRWDKNPSLPGVCKLNKKWIQLRPGCIEFLQKAFSSFRVGIWSTMTQRNVLSMCSFLEQQAHQSLPFFMLWSKDSCYQHRGVQRPNMGHVVADFKPLSRVWGHFKPYLGFHNTVLVDDSPYKACMNNPYNCIFPDAFEGYTDDKFLNGVLWPYLEKMRMSHNIQAYIANNPLGQPPVVVGHELYHHVHQVMNVFDYCASPLTRAA